MIIYIILQIFITLALAPFVNGVIKKVKAFSQKRKGAPILQMYFDIYKLLKKKMVISDVASWIFEITPYIVISTAMVGAIMVPITMVLTPLGYTGDIILLVYVLALGRFFLMLSGLDTGSTFGGMGSSREAMISCIIEPSLFVTIFTVSLISKSTSIYQIMDTTNKDGGVFANPTYIFLFLSILLIILAESSRVPVDDPSTHLELTMVHKAMILEYSGKNLAMMEYGAAIKQLIFITLLVNIFIPSITVTIFNSILLAVISSISFYIVKVIFISVLLGLIEVFSVKLRLFSVPNFATISFIFAFLGFLQYFVVGR